mmetsp:Transcript_21935/g.34361  ORF Transcript_21935/g.34361 Transcript_21935/m.34361 type:complete len:380 (+) Transcript_21935:439-1578(+)|eukprot:CAMPEP_0184328064 /NCGR_PEP_ID=MMETSP1049-20130417/143424_1 /TAXON_ID=77928 /ORGANISM="Proteomonas sulcata, Strain CCMP704" /LENGTH=379 /DNA_ID=CAMNT_0026650353 /DNA_START=217 /DNA_END=1356 /DNA_ORIENTATION=-
MPAAKQHLDRQDLGPGAADCGPSEKLASEAQALHPLLCEWRSLYERGRVGAAELVGAFILAYVSIREKKPFIRGVPQCFANFACASSTRSDNSAAAMQATAHASAECNTLGDFPGLVKLIGHQNLMAGLSVSGEDDCYRIPFARVFTELRLCGVRRNKRDFINLTLVEWMAKRRPLVLLFRIATPMEVLRMQANGERLVTMFTQHNDLSRMHTSQLNYMEGPEKFHSRDALDFLVHDLQHMQKFAGDESYREQVGFFRCVLTLNDGRPREFFADHGGDGELWHQMEYCICDMNCFSIHLFQYLKAKLMHAHTRLGDALRFHEGWQSLLLSFAISPGSKEEEAANAIGQRTLTVEEDQHLRDHFKFKGGNLTVVEASGRQ